MRLEPRIFGEQVAMGKVQAEAGQPLHGNVALVCRPDDVSLHSELPDGEHKNLFAGTVLHASFVGGSLENNGRHRPGITAIDRIQTFGAE